MVEIMKSKPWWLAAATVLIAAPLLLSACDSTPSSKTAPTKDTSSSNDIVIMQLKSGAVKIKLRADLAPLHVARVKKLIAENFYNGHLFHRVIPGFMAQTGDPTGTGSGGSDYPDLPAEFSQAPFLAGTIGAARTANPNSANSQFFICYTDNGCAHLKGKYTIWGQVVDGMDHINSIKLGAPGSGALTDPDKIINMQLGT